MDLKDYVCNFGVSDILDKNIEVSIFTPSGKCKVEGKVLDYIPAGVKPTMPQIEKYKDYFEKGRANKASIYPRLFVCDTPNNYVVLPLHIFEGTIEV